MHRPFRGLALACLLFPTLSAVAAESPALAPSSATAPVAAELAADAPSVDAVRELLTASDARAMLDATVSQMRVSLDETLAAAMQDPSLNDAQRKIVTEWKQEFIALFTDYLDWAKLEPMFVDIYRRSFTREEVESLVAFYRTPAGRALISKMPVVMQNSMTSMQARMAELQPRMEKLQSDLQAKLQAAGAPR